MSLLRIGAMLVVVMATGCSQASPRHSPHPEFYRHWPDLPEPLRVELEEARLAAGAEDPENPVNLQRYARATSRLGRYQAEHWLELAANDDLESAVQRERIARARGRLLECLRHSLVLYQQWEVGGGGLDWHDRLQCAWFMALSGDDEGAEEMILRAADDGEFPRHLEPELDRIRALLRPGGDRDE